VTTRYDIIADRLSMHDLLIAASALRRCGDDQNVAGAGRSRVSPEDTDVERREKARTALSAARPYRTSNLAFGGRMERIFARGHRPPILDPVWAAAWAVIRAVLRQGPAAHAKQRPKHSRPHPKTLTSAQLRGRSLERYKKAPENSRRGFRRRRSARRPQRVPPAWWPTHMLLPGWLLEFWSLPPL
jgi:hypothetical protein